MSCPFSKRGHAWRQALSYGFRYMADAELRLCARCSSVGKVDSQGRVIVLWEPDPCGAKCHTADASWVCGLPRQHLGAHAQATGLKLRPLEMTHPCDRADVRAVVLALGELEHELQTTDLHPTEYLKRKQELASRLMSALYT